MKNHQWLKPVRTVTRHHHPLLDLSITFSKWFNLTEVFCLSNLLLKHTKEQSKYLKQNKSKKGKQTNQISRCWSCKNLRPRFETTKNLSFSLLMASCYLLYILQLYDKWIEKCSLELSFVILMVTFKQTCHQLLKICNSQTSTIQIICNDSNIETDQRNYQIKWLLWLCHIWP